MGFEVAQIGTMFGSAYLLKGDRVALVDTLSPMGYRKLVRTLKRNGVTPKDVEFVLLTHHHFDHAGNAARIKELSGATVTAGALDAPVIEGTEGTPRPSDINRLGRFLSRLPSTMVVRYQSYERTGVDRKVRGGEMIEELGLEAIAVPGHTNGGICYLDREGRRAFIGDMVSYFYGIPGMPALSASESLHETFASQELLADMDLDIAYPGHGGIIEPNASRIIAGFMAKKKSKLNK